MEAHQGFTEAVLAAYRWSQEFTDRQPRLYERLNVSYINQVTQSLKGAYILRRYPVTVDDLIDVFLTVLMDIKTPHSSSIYLKPELQSVCHPGALAILSEESDKRVNRPLALLDDRSRAEAGRGEVRSNPFCLTTAGLLQQLQKKRYNCEGEPDAERRLLYITDPDGWVMAALALTTPMLQALFLPDFFHKYISNKTSLGINVPRKGPRLFALEFHFQFYVWRENGPIHQDFRRKRNGKPFRRSHKLQHLGIDEPLEAVVHEAQISCLVTGIDNKFWCAYFLVDTFYQGIESTEAVDSYELEDCHLYRPDPLTLGLNAHFPEWDPRVYFLTIYECRLAQVKHAMDNLLSCLGLRLEPYLHDHFDLSPLADVETSMSYDRKIKLQEMLNEASRLLRQTIHSISRIIEVWDHFSSQDAAYLRDIMHHQSVLPKPPTCGPPEEETSPFRVAEIIGEHIKSFRQLKARTEEQQDLCTGAARQLEMHLMMESNNITNQQHESGEMVKILTLIGLLFLPFTCTTALFSIQEGILPPAAYKWYWFVFCWLCFTLVVVGLSLLYKGSPFRPENWMTTRLRTRQPRKQEHQHPEP